MSQTIKNVAVLGCGLMGSGIAQVAATAGFETWILEVNQGFLDKGMKAMEKSLGKLVEKGKMTSADRDALQKRLHPTTQMSDLKNCDIVIEAIVEDIQEKCKMYKALDELLPAHAIFASNTSSLTVTEMAASTKRPDKFVGLHFFNPVPMMKLVEVVRALATSSETFDRAFEFAGKLGKTPIKCKDNSGFVVNLLLVPYLLDAIRAVEGHVASVDDIDKGMMLGCGYPMGPLTLLDFVGLDTTYKIAEIMFKEYRDAKYAPPPLLKKMVMAGYFGKKSGRGFYDYSGETPKLTDLAF